MKINLIVLITLILILILAILYILYPVKENYTNQRTRYSEMVLNSENSRPANSVNNSGSSPAGNSVSRSSSVSPAGNSVNTSSAPSSGPSSSLPSSIIPPNSSTFYLNNTSGYDPNNYDVEYHDNLTDLSAQSGLYNTTFQQLDISGNDGRNVSIPYLAVQALPTYYRPGSFIYGAATYVPNYEDSVYLSKSTGLSTVSNVYPTPEMLGGYCQQLKNDPVALELKCNSISGNDCASSQCCVLFGGAKCVSGDEKGPYRKENYSDTTLVNKDYYYYQGKCYGNCV